MKFLYESLNLRNFLLVALAVGFGLTTSDCLRRHSVIVVHEGYPAPVTVLPPLTAPEVPPAPQVETAPPAPSSSHVWVEGYWVWERGWRWRPGVWVVRPRPLAAWVSGHWVREPSAWVWVPGRWQ